MAVRNYSNTAGVTTLASSASAGASSITVSAAVGYPSAPFYITIGRGTASEEVCLVTNVAGVIWTVTRGQDGTVAYAHDAGATVEHTVVAADVREPNVHVNATSGVHGLGVGETVASTAYVDAAEADAKAHSDAHAALTTGVHGVGASFVASKAYVDGIDTALRSGLKVVPLYHFFGQDLDTQPNSTGIHTRDAAGQTTFTYVPPSAGKLLVMVTGAMASDGRYTSVYGLLQSSGQSDVTLKARIGNTQDAPFMPNAFGMGGSISTNGANVTCKLQVYFFADSNLGMHTYIYDPYLIGLFVPNLV